MLKFLKSIFKKSNPSNNRLSLFWWYSKSSIPLWDYFSYFTSWQYTAVTTIADSLSSLNYRLADKEDSDLNHEYLEYITPELLQNITIFMKITWTAYVLKVMNHNKVLWLSILLPQYLLPIVDSDWNLVQWSYTTNNGSVTLSVDEVMVFAEFNPNQRYPYITRWYSPLQAIAMAIKWEKEIERWNYSLLTNDVPPGMILTTDQPLTKEQVESIKENWEKNHTWSQNVGKLAILPFGIKPNSIQSSPKEMEFISQQQRDRDKILAIYKVPKAVVGIGEWVNVWNVKAFNQIYSSRCISPLAKKITRVLNDNLFKWIGTFEFLNVLPSDEDAVREHYLSWGITRNEYRMELWYKPVKWWDIFYNWEEAIVDVNENGTNGIHNKQKNLKKYYWINYKSIVNKYLPRTEEWMIERWNKKIIRYKSYEDSLKDSFLKIFNKQEEDVLKEIEKEFWVKSKNRSLNMIKAFKWLLNKKYYTLYYIILKDEVKALITKEWNRALDEIWSEETYKEKDQKLQKKIREIIREMAKIIDSTTDEKLNEVIWLAVEGWIELPEIKELIWNIFNDLKDYRLERILRTEIIRYWSLAEQTAREQSWLVKYKQWWTAVDERVCESCWKLYWKKIPLTSKFNGDYLWSPLHPNCRCDMIPLMD